MKKAKIEVPKGNITGIHKTTDNEILGFFLKKKTQDEFLRPSRRTSGGISGGILEINLERIPFLEFANIFVNLKSNS